MAVGVRRRWGDLLSLILSLPMLERCGLWVAAKGWPATPLDPFPVAVAVVAGERFTETGRGDVVGCERWFLPDRQRAPLGGQ